ncbi:MAG TPA: hypothetical protein VI231_14635 [Candidatus Binatia bacterium]|jgi:hypothetical protein
MNNVSRALGFWGDSRVWVVAGIILFLIGLFLAFFESTYTLFSGFIALASIAIGVTLDAMLDFDFRHYDRNLFPFEILIWWVVSPIPMILGVGLGKLSKKLVC